MKLNLTSRGGRIGIAVVAVAIAAYVFRSTAVRLLVEPIGWLLWAGWRLVASVDQSICWTVVVLISAVLVVRLLPPRMGAPEDSTPTHETQWGRAGRLHHWEELAIRAAHSQEGRTAFRASLTALAADVAERTRRSPWRATQVTGTERHGALLSRLLAGRRRVMDLRAIEDQLLWMESALEIKHEDPID